ncbi:MAG TPA: exodeoxyribonuclease VII large subunit [Pleomorphomonadaceae bacterium]|nr:exodeoxyribonuclease VII large subunit [Pleomorphomonadaceae bacterium]
MTTAPEASAGPRVWRVSDLNRRVRGLLDADAALADVWVEGEVSGPSFPPSGHCFFILKDANSQIRAVLFREELERATVRPKHGAQLVCHGRVRAYEPQGVYQLYVESVTPVGAGDLHAQYEALRAKLAAEGLFEESRKRPLPRWPRRIGVVTSPVGAVWDDICTVLRRRYPLVEVVLSPTAVQGGVSAPAIIRALKRLYSVEGLDLVILARGGGSIEDLWGFNDEHVVRTVAASPVPVVVGVGHESDITLADFAADRRAPTPSAAAEIAVPDGTQLPSILARLSERTALATTARLEAARRAVRGEGRALVGLRPDLEAARQGAAELLDRGHRALGADLERRRLGAAGLRAALRALGPLATLDRGYAVARRPDGMILRDPTDVQVGDGLEVIVARGAVDARVTGVRPGDMEELLG